MPSGEKLTNLVTVHVQYSFDALSLKADPAAPVPGSLELGSGRLVIGRHRSDCSFEEQSRSLWLANFWHMTLTSATLSQPMVHRTY